ncbi:hypothetical protein OC834_001117 [Tilletia horrida]|nr:hypothetical protein OC834_001117 [Tilletia horrida]
MTPPLTTSIVIDIVFIPIYAVLAGITVYNFIRLRSVKFSFGNLVAFALARFVGNICSVAAWANSYQDKELFTWSCILSIIGYGILFSSVLCLYNSTSNHNPHTVVARLGKAVHGVTTIASALLIIGILNSHELVAAGPPAEASAELSPIAEAGTALYIVVTAVLAVLVLLAKLRRPYACSPEEAPEQPWAAPLALNTSLLALPFLAVRLGYTCYTMFGSHLLDANVWARLVCAGIIEVILVVIFNVAGFRLGRHFPAMRASSSSSNKNKESEYHVAGNGSMVEQQSQYYGAGGYVQTRQTPSPDFSESQSVQSAWVEKHRLSDVGY